MGTKPGDRLMGQLERRAEAISGEFNWMDFTETIWFYAATHLKPSEDLVRGLEARAALISEHLRNHHVIMFFWAYAEMKLTPGHAFMTRLQRQARVASTTLDCKQLASFFCSVADGGAAFDVDDETYAMMSARTNELAGMFHKEEQSLLIWASVKLPVTHGPSTEAVLHRDVGAMLQKYAAPGKYQSKVVPVAAKGHVHAASADARQTSEVRVACECLSGAGQQFGVEVWQDGETQPFLECDVCT
jgi:hypothetical protein